MNKLNGLACYLSGPIDFDPDKGKSWRDDLTLFLEPLNVKVFNPLKHMFSNTEAIEKFKRPFMKECLDSGKYDELRKEMKELNHWDLRAVDLSSFLIVFYNTSIHMCGTIEEMTQANKQTKPVLIMAKNGKKMLPSWLYGRYPHEHFFESWDELKNYINNIDNNMNYKFTEADNKRWLFFDGPHMH